MHALWPLFLNTLHKEVRAKTIYVLAAALLAIAFFAMMPRPTPYLLINS